MPPKRQLGLVSAVALVVASMIGSGVFTTSGFLLNDLHTPARVLAVWLGGGLIALLGALSYGALARQFPESGGEYVFLIRTVHPAAGYIAGWVSLLVGFSAPLAAVALAFGEYTKPWLPASISPKLSGSCVVAAFATLHALNVQRGAWVQNGAVLIKLLLIVVLVAWASTHLRPVSSPPVADISIGNFAVALIWVSFSYSGWNAAAYVASEVRTPEHNLARAMALGTIVVTLIYLALNAVFVFAAPVEQLAGKLEIGRAAALALGGQALADFVTALITLALATCVSSMMMAGPRIYARMADDQCLPRWFCFPANGPPRHAILLQAAVALVMLWTATFQNLLTYIGFTLGLCTAGAVGGLIRLRLQTGQQVKVPGWPWVPVIFVVSVLLMSAFAVAHKPAESAVGIATLFLGWLAWQLQRAKQ
ncbi:MAG TPA: amino acid permease [Candidatus Limnocylindrales bacterium]|jgi:APA family basic amino acid/polyamine antiporter|nr:amino acid permease [Candidatus Limnocylindrales bacterium]